MYKSKFIPYIADTTDKGERLYDIYSRLLKDRIIILNGEIEENSASLIVAQLLTLEADSQKSPILMYINSPGGTVYDARMIMDTMEIIKCPVYTFGMGLVASAASLILACGTRGYRYALNRCRIMIHQPHGGARGQATDMEIQIKEMLLLKEQSIELLSERTGLDKESLRDMTERDFFMSAEEAKEKNLVDQVLYGNFDKTDPLKKIVANEMANLV